MLVSGKNLRSNPHHLHNTPLSDRVVWDRMPLSDGELPRSQDFPQLVLFFGIDLMARIAHLYVDHRGVAET